MSRNTGIVVTVIAISLLLLAGLGVGAWYVVTSVTDHARIAEQALLAAATEAELAAEKAAEEEAAAAESRPSVPRERKADDPAASDSATAALVGTVSSRTSGAVAGAEVVVYAAPVDALTLGRGGGAAAETVRKLRERLGNADSEERLRKAAEDGDLEVLMSEGQSVGIEMLAEGNMEDLMGLVGGTAHLEGNEPIGEALARVQTDAEGGFRVEDLDAESSYEVRVEVPGHVLGRGIGKPGERSIIVVLEPGGSLNGRVVSDGVGVGGARIRVTHKTLTADPDGNFSYDGAVMPKETLLVTAPGYVAAAKRVPIEPGVTAQVEISVLAAGSVTGHVRDLAGKPIAGALVAVRGGGFNPMTMMNRAQNPDAVTAPSPRTRTDDNGRYVLDGVAAGQVNLQAKAAGFLADVKEGIEIEIGAELEGVDFVLAGEAAVVGLVTDADGKPVAGARIRVARPADGGMAGMIQSMSGGAFKNGRSSPDGTYRVAGLAAGERKIEITAEGYLRHDGTVAIEVATETTYDVRLEGGFGIAGTVVDPEGNPLAGASVGIKFPRAGGSNPMQDMIAAMSGGGRADVTVESDADGTWKANGLQGGPYIVTANAEGFLPGKVEGVLDGADDVQIAVLPSATLRGIVLSQETGLPVPGAKVLYKGGPPRGGGNPMMAFMQQTPSVTAGPDGAFEVSGIEAGKYELWARAKPFAEGTRTEVACDAGAVVEGIELQLPPGATLVGRVVSGSESLPVAGADVFVSLASGPMAAILEDSMVANVGGLGDSIRTKTDEDGAFVLEGLTPGKLNVNIRSADFAPKKVVGHEVPGQDLLVTMGSGGTVQGHVKDTRGRPQSGANLTLLKGMMSPAGTASTDASGFFRFDRIAPGSYTLMLVDPESPMGMGGMASVAVKEGEVTEHDFSKQAKGRPLQGSVMRDGKPMANQPVVLMGGPSGMQMTTTNDQGEFEFGSLEPGTYQVMVQSQMMSGGTTGQEVIVGKDGELPRVDLQVATLDLKGRIVDADSGRGVPMAQIVLLEAGDGPTTSLGDLASRQRGQAFSDEDGYFNMQGVPGGAFQLRVTAQGFASAVLDGVSAGGPSMKVEMSAGHELRVVVLDPKGRAVSQATVNHEDAQGRESLAFDMTMSGQTDATGTARLRLAPGPYRIHVQADGYPSKTVETESSVGELRVTLDAGGRVTLTVVDADDNPLPGARVVLTDASGKRIQRRLSMANMMASGDQTDVSGQWDHNGVAPGNVTAAVTFDGRTLTKSLTVTADGQATATIRFQ